MANSPPEARFNKMLKDNLPNSHITRLESRVGLGIPDMLVALNPPGRFVMIEAKYVPEGSKKIKISPHQASFHLKHSDLKCPTFFAVMQKQKGVKYSRIMLFRGSQVEELLNLGVDTVPLFEFHSNFPQWFQFREKLLEKA